jgi:hypothetical protein
MNIRLRQCSRIAVYLFTRTYVGVAYSSNQSTAPVCTQLALSDADGYLAFPTIISQLHIYVHMRDFYIRKWRYRTQRNLPTMGTKKTPERWVRPETLHNNGTPPQISGNAYSVSLDHCKGRQDKELIFDGPALCRWEIVTVVPIVRLFFFPWCMCRVCGTGRE